MKHYIDQENLDRVIFTYITLAFRSLALADSLLQNLSNNRHSPIPRSSNVSGSDQRSHMRVAVHQNQQSDTRLKRGFSERKRKKKRNEIIS